MKDLSWRSKAAEAGASATAAAVGGRAQRRNKERGPERTKTEENKDGTTTTEAKAQDPLVELQALQVGPGLDAVAPGRKKRKR